GNASGNFGPCSRTKCGQRRKCITSADLCNRERTTKCSDRIRSGDDRSATQRAACLFGSDFVVRSSQTTEGYALVPVRKHLTPRLNRKSIAANAHPIRERDMSAERRRVPTVQTDRS